MKVAEFDNTNLSSFVKRSDYGNVDLGLEVLKYKNERLDYWFNNDCDCPYTEASKDVENKYGKLKTIN
jgi:hypothetical protein